PQLSATSMDAKRRKKRRELSSEQKAEIKDAFELFDSDNDNAITYHEFKVALRALGFDLKKSEDDSGKLSQADFTEIVTDMLLDRDPTDEIVRAFKLFDDDDSGKITFRNLKKVAKELGENMSDQELRAMIEEFDKDGDSAISLEEFMAIMTGEA
uniref:Centrin 3 n=1 Tax=Macrostomum lignano TaxID=282301 RepID=A0A1I8HWX4_9PLAT